MELTATEKWPAAFRWKSACGIPSATSGPIGRKEEIRRKLKVLVTYGKARAQKGQQRLLRCKNHCEQPFFGDSDWLYGNFGESDEKNVNFGPPADSPLPAPAPPPFHP